MPIYKEGPSGGDGGEVLDIKNIINDIIHINQITVRYSPTSIDLITICYQLPSGEPCVTWGKDPGSVRYVATITLQPSEWITSVKGYYGRCTTDDWFGVRSLTFETSFQNKYGPFGKEVGAPFEYNGDPIIGFHGRASDHIDALGAYIQFDDATIGGRNAGGSTGAGSGQ